MDLKSILLKKLNKMDRRNYGKSYPFKWKGKNTL